MLTKKSRLFLGLTAATPLLFAACTDNNAVSPFVNVAGTYQLTLFRGQTPPVVDTYTAGQISTFPNGGTVTWVDGTMVLSSTGTFVETNNYVVHDNGTGANTPSSFISSGSYTVTGTTFSLSAPAQNNSGARAATGTIVSNTIDYQESDGNGGFDTFEYHK